MWECVSDGYLYNLWNGTLKEMRGEIWKKKETMYGGRVTREIACFRITGKCGEVVKVLQCSENEGEVYNKSVWLSCSNKSEAAKILIKYEELQIAKLEYSIQNHMELISMLRNEV